MLLLFKKKETPALWSPRADISESWRLHTNSGQVLKFAPINKPSEQSALSSISNYLGSLSDEAQKGIL